MMKRLQRPRCSSRVPSWLRRLSIEPLEDRRLLASISGSIFIDLGTIGIVDESDVPKESAPVTLATVDGVRVDSTVTNDSGAFVFQDVSPGDYIVTQNLPADTWTQTVPVVPKYQPISVDSVEIDVALPQPFLVFKNVMVSGQVFDDINQNGAQDAGELGLANWTIKVSSPQESGSPVPPTDVPLITTDTNGNYSFLAGPGVYWVGQYQPPTSDWFQTSPANGGYHEVTIPWKDVWSPGGLLANRDFGNSGFNSISGQKFNDLNHDGIMNPNEPRLNGWEVELWAMRGTPDQPAGIVGRQQTRDIDLNGDGSIDPTTERGVYFFDGLPADTYQVREIGRVGWEQTAPGGRFGQSLLPPATDQLQLLDFTTFVSSGDIDGDYMTDLIVVSDPPPAAPGIVHEDSIIVYFSAWGSDESVGSTDDWRTERIAVPGRPIAAIPLDVDGDGDQDVVVATFGDPAQWDPQEPLHVPTSGNVTILWNDGHGVLVNDGTTFEAGNGPVGLTAADFNGDGAPDLAVIGLRSNTVSVMMNDGKGLYLLSQTFQTGNTAQESPTGVVAANLVGDGQIDVAVSTTTGILLFENVGAGVFDPPTIMANKPYGGGLHAADLNADGKQDLIATQFDAGGEGSGMPRDVDIYLNQGAGQFALSQTIGVGSRPSWADARDVNDDGSVDIVVANAKSQTISMLLNRGDGTMTDPFTFPVATDDEAAFFGTQVLTLADVTFFDGLPDVVVTTTRGITVLPNAIGFYTVAIPQSGMHITEKDFGNAFVRQFPLEPEGEPPWHNAVWPLDVNNDGHVSPVDALVVINYLNSAGSHDLPSAWGEGEADSGNKSLYWDVNNDHAVSPIDSLLVINYLNSQRVDSGAEGEGELNSLPLDHTITTPLVATRMASNLTSQADASGMARVPRVHAVAERNAATAAPTAIQLDWFDLLAERRRAGLHRWNVDAIHDSIDDIADDLAHGLLLIDDDQV